MPIECSYLVTNGGECVITIIKMKDECYEFLKNEVGRVQVVGFGSYGEVRLARNTQNGEIVAIKLIYNKNAKDEIQVHHKLNHPNIIKLVNYYYEKDKNTTYMVLEYASGGTLNEKIKFGYGQLNKALVRGYFRDICAAVQYLHANQYMHRDIKPENILITKDNRAKLCDFGFASILEYRSTLCGTFQYMAPEMIQQKPYDYRIDIWALGILLFELIQGYAPFRGQTGQQVITEMKKSLAFSNRFTPIEIDLIKKILRVNPDNRPETTSILQHAYFADDPDAPIVPKLEIGSEDTSKNQPQPEKKVRKDSQGGFPRKKETRKMDFLHKKKEIVREAEQPKPEEPKKEERNSESTKAQQIKKEQPPKSEPSKPQLQFKPYVPSTVQAANRAAIKSPTLKMGANLVNVSSPVHTPPTQQFNTSLQMNTGQVNNPFNTPPVYTNPNSSLKVASRPVTNQQPPSTTQAPISFVKQSGPGQMVSPSHQTQSGQQFYWKKV